MKKMMVIGLFLLMAGTVFAQWCVVEQFTGDIYMSFDSKTQLAVVVAMVHILHHVNIMQFGYDTEWTMITTVDLAKMTEWLVEYIKTKPLRGSMQMWELFVKAYTAWKYELW